MPRLLIVTTVPITLSGFLSPLAEYFRVKGWCVDAMTQSAPHHDPRLNAFGKIWGVDWSRNPLDWRNFLGTPRRIREIVEQEHYDLVHVHTPVAAFVTRFALREIRKHGQLKVIYTAHGFHFYRGGSPIKNVAFAALEKLAGRWTDHLVVLNREDEEAARRLRLVPAQHIHYMPGIGVDSTYYAPENVTESEIRRVREELRLSPTDRLFLMVAEFNPGKRHRDALRAFARMGPEAHLALAGVGVLLEEMKRLAATLGLQDRVHFLGFRRDIPTLVRASVAVLLPSEREGLPVSIMEAMSLSVPVIGTDIRGIRDLLGQGAGILVKVGDVAGLTEAMTWVLRHPQEAQAMGQKGRAQVVSTHDIRLILAMHEELFAEALGNKACT